MGVGGGWGLPVSRSYDTRSCIAGSGIFGLEGARLAGKKGYIDLQASAFVCRVGVGMWGIP